MDKDTKRLWIDAFGTGLVLMMLWPQLCEKRLWLHVTARLAREGARRCGQLAIAAETAYHREVA